jgi:hypothetical protein
MARQGFLSENEGRAYPFVNSVARTIGGEPFPDDLIVDARFTFKPSSRHTDVLRSIWLKALTRVGDFVSIQFDTDAPEMDGMIMTFNRKLTDPEFAASTGTITLDDSVTPVSVECDGFFLEGILVTGRFDGLKALLPDDGILAADERALVIEASLVQNLGRRGVTSLNLANASRTMVIEKDDCGSSSSSSSSSSSLNLETRIHYIVNATCIISDSTLGDPRIKAGYNCAIDPTDRTNTLTISAQVGAGAGEPCAEVPIFETEIAPKDSPFLSGGPGCDEFIRSINGVSGPNILIQSSSGVTCLPDPLDSNTLIIDFPAVGT